MIVINGYIIEENTKAIIFKAIQYWKTIENKELLCNVYSLNSTDEFEIKPLTESDKKCASLFLAALTENTEVKIIMNKNGINLKKILKYFKTNSMKVKKFNKVELYTIFNEEFQTLIKKLKNSDTGKYFYPEELILNLNYRLVCESNIIEWIFKYFKFKNYQLPSFENPVMQEIKKTLFKKVIDNQPHEEIGFEEIFAPVFDFIENSKKITKPINSMCRVLKFPGNYQK